MFAGLFMFFSKKYIQNDPGNSDVTHTTNLKQQNVRSDFSKKQTIKLSDNSSIYVKLEKEHTIEEQDKSAISVSKAAISVSKSEAVSFNKKPKPCYNVHVFYYPWYGNPKYDNSFLHWNHVYMPHWNREIAKMYKSGIHKPPDDIGSDFYPELGPYSSRDPSVIKDHMAQLYSAGVGVIIVSYYPPGSGDDNGKDWQDIFPLLFNAAHKYKIKVGFHIEPYKNRDENTVKMNIERIIDDYSSYPAFYMHTYNKKTLPLIYIYDSYHTKPKAWATILKSGPNSIRGTPHDAFVIGLFVNKQDGNDLHSGGFDGFYTYFAADGFTYGSTRRKWKDLKTIAFFNKMLFIPSVGPGYIDTRIRPWNKENTRKRANGKYYEESWNTALDMNTEIISVTSFNEWHEGTQIEKAVPYKFRTYDYENYLPHSSDYYLKMTKKFVEKFNNCKISRV